jgi:hypothetical protein
MRSEHITFGYALASTHDLWWGGDKQPAYASTAFAAGFLDEHPRAECGWPALMSHSPAIASQVLGA